MAAFHACPRCLPSADFVVEGHRCDSLAERAASSYTSCSSVPRILERRGLRGKLCSEGHKRVAAIGSPPAEAGRIRRRGGAGSRSHGPRYMAVASNGTVPTAAPEVSIGARVGEVARNTKETRVTARIDLDGTGVCDAQTGIPFLDHMLDQLASHGLFDVAVKADGDLHIDDHHTNEDVALALGTALAQALGDRKGIHRFGDFCAPLDEALVHVVLDLSGRPHLTYGLDIPTARVGTYDTQLVEHFYQSLANNSGMTLHVRQLAGRNSHHIIEASFKAFARALRRATEVDPRRGSSVPSSKGVLSRT